MTPGQHQHNHHPHSDPASTSLTHSLDRPPPGRPFQRACLTLRGDIGTKPAVIKLQVLNALQTEPGPAQPRALTLAESHSSHCLRNSEISREDARTRQGAPAARSTLLPTGAEQIELLEWEVRQTQWWSLHGAPFDAGRHPPSLARQARSSVPIGAPPSPSRSTAKGRRSHSRQTYRSCSVSPASERCLHASSRAD